MTKFAFYPADKNNFFETYAAEFKYDQDQPTPWKPVQKDLEDSLVCLITTSGMRLKSDKPFQINKLSGSSEFKEFTVHATENELAVDMTNYHSAEAMKDINVLIPVEHIIEMVERKNISKIHETIYSFCGFCKDIEQLKQSTKRVIRKLIEAEVDLILISTASHLCNVTACIIARELEKSGISCTTIVTVKEIAHEIKVPRAVFINFPFGMTFGRAFSKSLQKSIAKDMLDSFVTIDKPGKIIELPYKWDGTAEVV